MTETVDSATVAPATSARPSVPPAVFAMAIGAAVVAWTLRFLHDAAFVSFQYARSWSQGGGLTWFGERVEGYSNFLWVAWLRLGFELGVEPGFWAHLAGAASLAITVVLTWRVASIVFSDPRTPLVATAVVASNFSVLALSVSGSETMLQTLLLTASVLLAFECYYDANCSARRALLLSLILTLALLTRMDSVVIVSPTILIAIAGISRASGRGRQYFALLAPVTILIGASILLRYGYYGRIVPNTFDAWIDPDLGMLANGAAYVWSFLRDYLIWAPLVAAAGIMIARRIPLAPRLGFPMLLAVAWAMYIVLIGGDYQEYRFIVPAFPLVALVLAFAVEALVTPLPRARGPVMAVLTIAIAVVSFIHGRSTDPIDSRTILSVPQLATANGLYPDEDWGRVGRRLADDLSGTGATIAAQSPGAIAYFSGLRTFDMWGLNDGMVAQSGVPAPEWWRVPGRRRAARLERMKSERITFILSETTLAPLDQVRDPASLRILHRWLESTVPFSQPAVDSATVVAMPLDSARGVLMWYLTPSPAVTARIRQRGWIVRSIVAHHEAR